MESVMEKTTGWGLSPPPNLFRSGGGQECSGGASGSGVFWWTPRGSVFRNVLAADWN